MFLQSYLRMLKCSRVTCQCYRNNTLCSMTGTKTNPKRCNDEIDNKVNNLNTVQSKPITNYDYFINEKSRRRTPSALREITKRFSTMPPDTISFAVGVPNVTTFPFEEISIKLKDGSQFNLSGRELEIALQYLPSTGYGQLVEQLQKLQDKIHGVQDWSRTNVMLTCGSNEAMSNVFDMVLTEDDVVIMPVPLYTGAADALRMLKPQYVKLEQDKDGIHPQQLRKALEARVQQSKPLPKLMYINPTACNPTGRNVPLERKQEIYKLACEYDFLIVEDDPYYSLHFMERDIPSFLSLDVEGRVIRLDSFSKILSSGLRLGYVTGPKQLIRQIELHLQTSTLHTSAISQVLVSSLLKHWGYDQYFVHIEQVKKFYRERRDLMVAACERHLKGVAEWAVPEGGMFLWMKIPALRDTMNLAVKHCLEHHLLIVPGHAFAGDIAPQNYNYIRLSFSLATTEQMEDGTKLLAHIIKGLKDQNSP